ncbi:oligosaccharide flippase family protein, partial [Salmonella enterica]|uniref:oligosaccharide flippase family protein n=1 Tax=Salmonella enterica TaxID=28901 RepID=UPI00398C4C83
MQHAGSKAIELNHTGSSSSDSLLAGLTCQLICADFCPRAPTAILGFRVNSAVRTLLFGYFGRKLYRPGLHFSLASVSTHLRFGAWLSAVRIVHYINTYLSTLVLARIPGANFHRGNTLAYNFDRVTPRRLNPSVSLP